MPELPEDEDRTGDEATVAEEMLDYLRVVLLRKAHGLTDEQLAQRLGPSEMTIGGLVLHMALVEDIWFTQRLEGKPQPSPWADVDWTDDYDWDFHQAHTFTHAELVAQFETSVARSRAAYAAAQSLEAVARAKDPQGNDAKLRWIMVHMVEEYARHCGHADLIRESIDGTTGD